jgi:hypothetical protein
LKKLEPLLTAGAAIFLILLGVYALITGEMTSRTGKPVSTEVARLSGIAFVGLGTWLLITLRDSE